MILLVFVYVFVSLALVAFGASGDIDMIAWVGAALYAHAIYSLLERAASQRHAPVLTIFTLVMAIATFMVVTPLADNYLPANLVLRTMITTVTVVALLASALLLTFWHPIAGTGEEEGI